MLRKRITLSSVDQFGDDMDVVIDEDSVLFESAGNGSCNVADLDELETLQKALKAFIAWRRLHD